MIGTSYIKNAYTDVCDWFIFCESNMKCVGTIWFIQMPNVCFTDPVSRESTMDSHYVVHISCMLPSKYNTLLTVLFAVM
jgi:hypothetical protein